MPNFLKGRKTLRYIFAITIYHLHRVMQGHPVQMRLSPEGGQKVQIITKSPSLYVAYFWTAGSFQAGDEPPSHAVCGEVISPCMYDCDVA